MSRESIVFILGLLVFLAPFVGVPSDWKRIGFIVFGAVLMLLGYSLRRSAFLRALDTGEGERRTDAFVERVRSADENTEDVVRDG